MLDKIIEVLQQSTMHVNHTQIIKPTSKLKEPLANHHHHS